MEFAERALQVVADLKKCKSDDEQVELLVDHFDRVFCEGESSGFDSLSKLLEMQTKV